MTKIRLYLSFVLLLFALNACFPTSPVTTTLSASKTVLSSGETITLTALVSHSSSKTLTYYWSCDYGTVPSGSHGHQISYSAPTNYDGLVKITVIVIDGENNESSAELSLTVRSDNEELKESINSPSTITQSTPTLTSTIVILNVTPTIVMPTTFVATTTNPNLPIAGHNKQFPQHNLPNAMSVTMAYIPAGEFFMGALDHDILAQENEMPGGWVFLDDYTIMLTEVTKQMYISFLNDLGKNSHLDKCNGFSCIDIEVDSYIEIVNNQYEVKSGYSNYPITGVTWHGADMFCKWARLDLPSEAQWEKAARWDSVHAESLIYPWGNSFMDGYAVIGQEFYHPVGSFPVGNSPYGLYDMAGNVAEWTNSDYTDNYETKVPKANHKVIRGGFWVNYANESRTSWRSDLFIHNKFDYIGFRCVNNTP